MAEYTIECDIYHSNISYCGNAHSERTIELSDEEVKTLVSLIRDKQSTDFNKLGLKENYPDLYKKLDEAYRQLYYEAGKIDCLKEGHYLGIFEYDSKELKQYCIESCGYKYVASDTDFDENDDEEILQPKHFEEWLDDYIDSLPYDELCDFFHDHLNADVDSFDPGCLYWVQIPKEIIKMAELPDSN